MIAQRKRGERFPAGGAMRSTAGGRNGSPTATVSPESLPPGPPQLFIQDGELLVRVAGRAMPLTTWLARWLARAERAQRGQRSADCLSLGGPGEADILSRAVRP
jgi:hypothetical protein